MSDYLTEHSLLFSAFTNAIAQPEQFNEDSRLLSIAHGNQTYQTKRDQTYSRKDIDTISIPTKA